MRFWPKRKPRNRRLGRRHVLDVKLRSSKVRAARARMAAVAVAVVFASVLGIYFCWRFGEWGLSRLVYENKAFAIETIDVQTDGALNVPQLRRWSGVKLGDNLLALDLARVKRNLELVSRIQSVSVERILPHTLRLRITEREPVAQLTLPRPARNGRIELALLQVDTEGYVMLPLDPRLRTTLQTQPPAPLPAITGLNPLQIQVGHRLESASVQAAIRLLQAFDHSAMAGLVDLKRVDVSAPEVLVVTTDQGSQVTFGLGNPEPQLRRWHEIFQLGRRINKAIATLDLAVTNNIPARWLEASALPPPAPKPPKFLRKNHV